MGNWCIHVHLETGVIVVVIVARSNYDCCCNTIVAMDCLRLLLLAVHTPITQAAMQRKPAGHQRPSETPFSIPPLTIITSRVIRLPVTAATGGERCC